MYKDAVVTTLWMPCFYKHIVINNLCSILPQP